MVCYSHADEPYRRALETILVPLEKVGLITRWDDRKIRPGDEWRSEIDARMKSASIILLLLTRNFLASDYCYDVEMRQALERHDQGTARVIPIVVSPVDLVFDRLARLEMLPKGGRAVTQWKNRDEALKNISQGLRAVVETLKNQPLHAAVPARTGTGWPTLSAMTWSSHDEPEGLKREVDAMLVKPQALQPHADVTAGADLTKGSPSNREGHDPADLAARLLTRAKPLAGVGGAAGGGNR